MKYPRSWKVSSISQKNIHIIALDLWLQANFHASQIPISILLISGQLWILGETLNGWIIDDASMYRISQVSFHVFPANRGSCFHGYVRHFAYHSARSRIRKVDVAATSSVPQRASSPSWCGPGGDGSHGVEWKKSCATRRMVECLWIMETIC